MCLVSCDSYGNVTKERIMSLVNCPLPRDFAKHFDKMNQPFPQV